MKKTESEEESNNFKNTVKGHRIIPIWRTFSLSPTLTPQRCKLNRVFERVTDVKSRNNFST